MTIVVYCPTCNYFLKVTVGGPDKVGTHGCMQCNGQMEVYVPDVGRNL